MDQDSVKDLSAECQRCRGNVDSVLASFGSFPDLSVLAGFVELVLRCMLGFAGFKIMLNCGILAVTLALMLIIIT